MCVMGLRVGLCVCVCVCDPIDLKHPQLSYNMTPSSPCCVVSAFIGCARCVSKALFILSFTAVDHNGA